MKQIIIVSFLFILPFTMEAQLGGLLNKVKTKVENKINKKQGNATDGAENKPGKKTEQTPSADEGSTAAETSTNVADGKGSIAAYSKFDFIAGDKVLYSEDFAQDNIGELPLQWNASGKGEVVTLEKMQGKWLRMYTATNYLSGNKKPFGENYTIEFDMLIDGTPPKGTRYLPIIDVGLFQSGSKDPSDNEFLKSLTQTKMVKISIQPCADAGSRMQMQSKDNNQPVFTSDLTNVPAFNKTLHKIAHYSIQVQKQRLRFWVNEQKIFDVPRAISESTIMNQLFFNVESYSYYDESNFGLYLSNFKIATGLPDTRHKLLEEGKFSTTGILFNVNSDVIKPQSYGIIKEIADVLKGNPSVNIKVIGHTDSDGNDAANLELSKKRAAAVKEALEKEYGIDAARITTDGKGESQPVADNKTKEGKAQNRRVEFIKI